MFKIIIPQKIPYELLNAHRTGLIVNLDPPDKQNIQAILKHYLSNYETKEIDYEKLSELLKEDKKGAYSNSHLKSICEIATEKIKPKNEPLTTEMIIQAIDNYNGSSDNIDLLKITRKYLNQYKKDQNYFKG